MQTVEMMRLSDVVGADRNAKQHSLSDLQASIKRFGFVAPLIRNLTTGKLVAGHGRTEALRALQKAGASVPPGIEVGAGGEWFVRVVSVPFANRIEEEAYILADNRQVELAGYDAGILSAMLADLRDADALAGVGWSEKEVDAMLKSAAKDSTLPQSVLDEADATMDALDVGEAETRELVLHIEADEYQGFVSRLQAVMKAARGASWTDAVKALLDRWESDDDA